MNKGISSEKGFSLIEILIALIVLSILTLPFLNTFTFYINMNNTSINLYYAAVAAQNTIEDIKGQTLPEIMELSKKSYIKIDDYYVDIAICPIEGRSEQKDSLSVVFKNTDDINYCYIFCNNLTYVSEIYDLDLTEDMEISLDSFHDKVKISIKNNNDPTYIIESEFRGSVKELHLYTYDKPDELPVTISVNGFDQEDIKIFCYEDLYNINNVSYRIDGIFAELTSGRLQAGGKDFLYNCYRSEKQPRLFFGVSVRVLSEPDIEAIIQRHTFGSFAL